MATRKPKAPEELKMVQITTGHWISTAQGNQSFSVVGLSDQGKVYRYDVGREGWVPWNMQEIEPRKKA